MVNLTNLVASVDILGNPFRHDVACSLQGFFLVVDVFFLVNEAFSHAVHVVVVLRHDEFCQWFKAFLTCNLGLGAAFRLVGEIQVLDILQGLGIVYLFLKFRRQFFLLCYRFQHKLLAFLELIELFEAFLHIRHGFLVHRVCHFLAVTRNERYSGTLAEQLYHILGHSRRNSELLRYLICKIHNFIYYLFKIFHAASACNCNIINPLYVLAPCFFASAINFVVSGL